MGKWFSLAALILKAALALSAEVSGQDPVPMPIPAVVDVEITFPVEPVVDPSPQPAPPPKPVVLIKDDHYYVITSDKPIILRASPKGLVKITHLNGPQNFRGKFVDGTGKVESRTYTQKHVIEVVTVEGAKGEVTLTAIPIGVQDEAEIVDRIVSVNHAPQPPPDPIDPVDPVDPPVPVGPLNVLFLYETDDGNTREQENVLFSKKMRDWMDANGVGWRVWDDDVEVTTEEQKWKDMLKSAKSASPKLPCMVVFHGEEGVEYPLEKTPEKTIEFLTKQKGEK